jgi:hypothetical protein
VPFSPKTALSCHLRFSLLICSNIQLRYILTYRNEEATRITTNAIHDNGRLLAELATLSNQSTDAVSRLTIKTQRDSRAMKVLTVVAALYLPATLMATIFSSNLVQLVGTQGGNSSSDRGHFVVAADFWVFPTFTIVLMILTLFPVWMWIRRPYSVKSRKVEV